MFSNDFFITIYKSKKYTKTIFLLLGKNTYYENYNWVVLSRSHCMTI